MGLWTNKKIAGMGL
jgi:hypothetical protein